MSSAQRSCRLRSHYKEAAPGQTTLTPTNIIHHHPRVALDRRGRVHYLKPKYT